MGITRRLRRWFDNPLRERTAQGSPSFARPFRSLAMADLFHIAGTTRRSRDTMVPVLGSMVTSAPPVRRATWTRPAASSAIRPGSSPG
jgi:hypothetical protein